MMAKELGQWQYVGLDGLFMEMAKCGGRNGHAETSPMMPKAVRPDLYDPRMPSTSQSHLRNILITCNPFRMRFLLVLLPPWWYCHAKTVLMVPRAI